MKLLLVATLVILAGCDLFSSRTGGGTETESAIVLHHLDGSPAVGARVRLRPADYLADSLLVSEEGKPLLDAMTDARGAVALPELPGGSWRLEADGGNGRGLVADFVTEAPGDPIRLADDTLRPHGGISGTFAEADPSHARFVQILGMERLVIADPVTGAFMVNGLPPGRYDLRFLALAPFRKEARRSAVAVQSGEVARLEAVDLLSEAKLAFRVDSGSLRVDGLGDRNPVVLDNEFWSNVPETGFAWALASAGRLDLKGNIVTDAFRFGPTVDAQVAQAANELRLARLAGMQGIPEPVAGSRRRLVMPASGRLEDIVPESSPGVQLILTEARKASPERPLVVVAGGALTTVANALLLDTSIAPRMVVAGVYSFTINSADTLATYVVAKRGRLVTWGRNYVWNGVYDSDGLEGIPGSRLGESLRAYVQSQARSGRLGLGDIAPLAYLADRRVWTAAEMARIAPSLAVQPASALSFDFLDIPAGGNDWAALRRTFFAALGDTAAYHPVAVPGRLEAEGFSARSVVTVINYGAPAGQEAMGGFAAGAFLEIPCRVDTARAYRARVRYRASPGAMALLASPDGQPVALALPASWDWTEAEAELELGAGRRILRITHKSGSFDIDRVDLE